MLCAIEISSTSLSPCNVFGNAPTSKFSLTSKTAKCSSFPISSGKQPVRLLPITTNSFKFFIWPMLEGIQPLIPLLAKTMTDAGEFPIFSGIVDVNLLLFINIASSVLLKSSGGISPSNSLNLISMNFISGIERTWWGNLPTKRLLLISNSCKSFNFEKLFGRTPQNLFEFICKRAISANKPNSAGMYPAMSAWLRSIPATTWIFESLREAAQKIPL